MVLGHLTVTAAAHRLLGPRIRSLAALPLGMILLGAYLPDLVDKSVNLLSGLSGRGYGHSLVVQVVLGALLYWLLPQRFRLPLAACALGAAVHLLQDWVEPAVWLAPLLGPIPPGPRFSFFDSALHYYRQGGPQVWIELLAAGYWLALVLHRRRGAARTPAAPEKAVAYAE